MARGSAPVAVFRSARTEPWVGGDVFYDKEKAREQGKTAARPEAAFLIAAELVGNPRVGRGRVKAMGFVGFFRAFPGMEHYVRFFDDVDALDPHFYLIDIQRGGLLATTYIRILYEAPDDTTAALYKLNFL